VNDDPRPDDPLRESARPDTVRGIELDDAQRAPGEHLRAVHDMYRGELDVLERLAALVRAGDGDLDDLRGTIHGMAVRTNVEQFGAICLRYCGMVATHHTIEDRAIFPAVAAADDRYARLVEQLEHEHHAIHGQLRRLDGAVLAMDRDRSDATVAVVLDEVTELARALRSHFAYEETQLAEPLGLHGVMV
jgi:hypothetical protein